MSGESPTSSTGMSPSASTRMRRASSRSCRAISAYPSRRSPLGSRPISRFDGREALALPPARVEIRGIEPALVARLERGPVSIDDRIPGRVAVALLVYRGLAKEALVLEAGSQGGGAGGRVERVAFPLVAAIAELIEDTPHHEEHRLGRRGGTLERWRIVDVPDLDHAGRGVDPQIARHT